MFFSLLQILLCSSHLLLRQLSHWGDKFCDYIKERKRTCKKSHLRSWIDSVALVYESHQVQGSPPMSCLHWCQNQSSTTSASLKDVNKCPVTNYTWEWSPKGEYFINISRYIFKYQKSYCQTDPHLQHSLCWDGEPKLLRTNRAFIEHKPLSRVKEISTCVHQ